MITQAVAIEVVVRLPGHLVRPEVLFQLAGELLGVAEVVENVDDARSPYGSIGLGCCNVPRHRSYTSTTTALQIKSNRIKFICKHTETVQHQYNVELSTCSELMHQITQ